MLTKMITGILVMAVAAAPGRPAAAQAPSTGNPSREAIPHAEQAAVAQIAAEAHGALRRGDYSGAIRGFEKLVQMAPGVAEFHANLGMAYYSSGRHLDAVAEFRQALRRKPDLIHAHYFLGASLAESGQCKEALLYLEEDYPHVKDPPLQRTMGMDALRCAMAFDQADKAVDFVRSLSRDFPDDPDVLYLSSHVYSDLSTRASQRLLVTAPGSYQAHQLNAEVLELQGKLSEAAEEYRKVLSVNPRLPGIHYRLGRLLLAGERGPATLDEARREFDEELQIDPVNAAAEYELGEMARQARQWNEAIEHFTRAVQLDPSFAEARIGLGKSLVSAGRASEALRPLEAAVQLEPDNPVAHYQLSFAYRRLGREQEAEKELVAYRQAHEKAVRTLENIRAGIVGRTPDQQTAEPPE